MAEPPQAQVKLWVDDDRQAPYGWAWAKSSLEAIQILEAHDPGVIGELSLDYSLGGWDNGGLVLEWLRDHPERWPATVVAHSANADGYALLEHMIAEWKPQ